MDKLRRLRASTTAPGGLRHDARAIDRNLGRNNAGGYASASTGIRKGRTPSGYTVKKVIVALKPVSTTVADGFRRMSAITPACCR